MALDFFSCRIFQWIFGVFPLFHHPWIEILHRWIWYRDLRKMRKGPFHLKIDFIELVVDPYQGIGTNCFRTESAVKNSLKSIFLNDRLFSRFQVKIERFFKNIVKTLCWSLNGGLLRAIFRLVSVSVPVSVSADTREYRYRYRPIPHGIGIGRYCVVSVTDTYTLKKTFDSQADFKLKLLWKIC